MKKIVYKTDIIPKTEAIIEVYRSSGIRRPIDDPVRIEKMYENSSLVVSAWSGEELIGIARSLTDFSYCCYLSDLAVKSEFQKRGIGKELIRISKEQIGDQSMLLLLSAPNAMGYYPRVGFDKVANGFIIKRSS